ncbi:MAG: hypothetical protein IT178_11770 [Acidobacteria bacterium]|nr:hypothetical protein [Acidobacteriota bacterium]
MSDPQTPAPLPAPPPSDAGEDARIEALLVTGLDHYFAGEFDTAINVWTRVLFLDRHHDRARAYIERARSAQAEQQRQSEALVHQGLDAFDRGEVERARALLSDALDRGASHDLALGVLGRIERLDVAAPAREFKRRSGLGRSRIARPAAPDTGSGRRHGATFWIASGIVVLACVVASWWMWTTNTLDAWWPLPAVEQRMSAIPETTGPLPTPSVAETYVRRGRALFESGRLHDALAELDRVPAGDPLRPVADELRARAQRELLALTLSVPPSRPAVASTPEGAPRP